MPPSLPLARGRRLAAAGLLSCSAFLFSAGCGTDYKARGEVKGKVTAGGKPLTAGSVMFHNPEGLTASASIDADGNYTLPDAPVGDCQVTVRVPSMPTDPSIKARMTGKGKGPKLPEGPRPPEGVQMSDGLNEPPPMTANVPTEIVPIDEKFGKPETSGLKFTVNKGGQQTYNIELPEGPPPPKTGRTTGPKR
ncbi:MAG: carboxypeptidase-like regulatory domain-containing protein [Gemmataceae bacterium]|nr:carboxypeptidase-like regulatory domain-containing protein [Gemmataceae bacterium]